MPNSLEVSHLSHRYPPRGREQARDTLHDVSFRVEAGRVGCLLGPSGCGKTTLLRCVAGLEPIGNGTIRIGERIVADGRTHIEPEDRGVGVVFQDYALFPHLDVAGNVGFGLNKLASRERDARVQEALELVRLRDTAHAYPHELSGGQQQRVAVARAVVNKPKLILADEPTGNLDSHNGNEVMELLTELNEQGTTIVMVTHSEHDSRYSHRIIRMLDGQSVTENILI